MTRTPVTVEDDLNIEWVRLDALLKWPGNPKEHDVGAIAASVLRFGFRDPIAVNSRTNHIEEGHGRLETLDGLRRQNRGVPRFIRIATDGMWLVPVLFFDDDDLTAHGYALAHNRTQELGGGYDDTHLLAALLEQATHGALNGTGFEGDDIDALRRKLDEQTGAESIALTTRYQVVVECAHEGQQVELLERFQQEGLNCRALIS